MTSTRTKISKSRAAAGAQPHTRRSTVYLLQDVSASGESMREGLNLTYQQEHGFEIQDVSIGLSHGLLYTGVIARGRPPEWADAVRRLTGVSPGVENKMSAGALLVPVDGKVFALTFGMGHLLLKQSRLTPGFGFGFALRVLKPDAVRQVTHSMMDARGRTDRNSAAQDQHIHGFGIEEYGEVVSRLAGKLGETSLTLSKGRKQAVQISGTDALKIHLGADANDLLADLAELNRIATTESPAPEFDAIARVRPLKPADERRSELDRRLETLLGDPAAGSIAVTVPTTLLDEEDGAMSCAGCRCPGRRADPGAAVVSGRSVAQPQHRGQAGAPGPEELPGQRCRRSGYLTATWTDVERYYAELAVTVRGGGEEHPA